MEQTLPLLRVLLVDDHAVVRAGLRNLIGDEPGLKVVGEAATCAQGLQLALETVPDVVVLDLRLPDGSGVDIVGALKSSATGVRILVLTSFDDDTLLLAALKAGADGYLLKDVAESDLIGAVRQVARAGAVMPFPSVQRAMPSGGASRTAPLETLNGQERKVYELVAGGHSNIEVAAATGLSEKTVRNYLTRVFEKLGVRRRSELTALYMATGVWRHTATTDNRRLRP